MRAMTRRASGTFLVAGLFAAPARPQQTMSSAPTISTSPQELAKNVHNPFEDFVKIQLQSTTGFSVGASRITMRRQSEPSTVSSLPTANGIVVRPSLSLNYQPSPHEQFGLTDLQLTFLSPHIANEWVWGIGPILQFPTATSPGLGRRWSAGPDAALTPFEWLHGSADC